MAMTNVYQIGSTGTTLPREITGTVGRIERVGHTVYGNPTMRVYVEGTSVDGQDQSGIYRISDNASLVYAIENPEFRDEPHTFAITKAGRISHVIRK